MIRGEDINTTLTKINSLAENLGQKAYLVGGYLRDLVLGRANKDLDFALTGKPEEIGRAFANYIRGDFFVLGEGGTRVIKVRRGDWEFDFTPLRAKSIEDDLKLRDFTINALALDLEDLADGYLENIIDPCGGRVDIEKRLIRVVYRDAFVDDPLRTVRAVRLMGELGFDLEKGTRRLIVESAPYITEVSGERLRDELARILSSKFSGHSIKLLDDIGLLSFIFPHIDNMRGIYQGGYHHLDVWNHSLLTLERLEGILNNLGEHFGEFGNKIEKLLKENLSGGRGMTYLLKLAALFHDISKPQARWVAEDGSVKFYGHENMAVPLIKDISSRLKLSLKESRMLKGLVANHMYLGHLSGEGKPSRRVIYRFFRKTNDFAIPVIILSLADGQAIQGILEHPSMYQNLLDTARMMVEIYFTDITAVKPPRLISGTDIMGRFGLKEGPIIGELLSYVEESTAEGKVKNREEALNLVAEVLEGRDKWNGKASSEWKNF